MKIKFDANPTQKDFIESRAEADLFSSRKGEGKSAALCWAIMYHTKHNPGATWLVIRDTWENLRRTTLKEFLGWFPDGVMGTWNAGEKSYTWNTAATGLSGKVYWMGAEDEMDASKIASMPLAGFAIDEPSGAAGETSGVDEFIFDTAKAQLRQPGMKWYAIKLAQNNPDEGHWTYRRFVAPGTPPDPDIPLLPAQESGFKAWQTKTPENTAHLPPGYYEGLRKSWAHRPDLVRRFVDGKYGYQQVGRPVTPEWSDDLHLSPIPLKPMRGLPLHLLYDGGLNPTCLITQVTPLGYWNILETFVGDGIGMFQLIETVAKPAITARYHGFGLIHVGDPNLAMREQSDARNSAAKVITRELGGVYHRGGNDEMARIEPLRAVLTRVIQGRGVMQVDPENAIHVHRALRGGWHYGKPRGGGEGKIKKNMHSHPGDALGYGAAWLFPLGKATGTPPPRRPAQPTGGYYNNAAPHPGTSLGMARKGIVPPKHGHQILGKL